MLQYRVYLRGALGMLGDHSSAGDFIQAAGSSPLAASGLPGTAHELSARFLDGLSDAQLVALAGLLSDWRRDGAAQMLADAARWTMLSMRVEDIESDGSVSHLGAIGWPRGVSGYRLLGGMPAVQPSSAAQLEVCVPEVFTRTEGAVHTQRYGVGDLIAPGRWGRLTIEGGPEDRHFYREGLWEDVRQHEFPDRPSRLTCGFAWVGQPGWSEPDPDERMYEVVWQTPDAFLADPAWLRKASGVPFDELVARARRYWSGEGTRSEALVPGELTVVRVLR